jgi:hypothetical protein
MRGRVFLAFLFLSSTASAVVPGPATQLSFGNNDSIEPAISGNWVVWTTDTGQPNELDIFSYNRNGGVTADITPFAGNQFLDDVDGHYGAYLDDSGAFIKVLVKDLTSANAAITINDGDGVSASDPAISNPGGANTFHVAYVRGGAHPDVIYYNDFFTPPAVLTLNHDNTQLDGGARPRITGDVVVFQAHAPNDANNHIYIWHPSQGGDAVQLTNGGNDTSPDTDGTNVVFTRDGNAILAVSVNGGATTQLSANGAAGSRDRPHVDGNNVVWDDHRNGVDSDVYWSAIGGGGDALLIGGPGDQFLTDVDASDVVYTDGPNGGPHNVFLVHLFDCNTNADCSGGKVCVNNACVACTNNGQCGNGMICQNGGCKVPQCVDNTGCNNGQVCVNNNCVACTSNNQCTNGQVCQNGACVVPQCVDNLGCKNGQVCVNNNCVACTSNAQCSQGFECKNGACVDPPQCGNNGDCNNGQVCVNGSCVACTHDAQCSHGDHCEHGVCRGGCGRGNHNGDGHGHGDDHGHDDDGHDDDGGHHGCDHHGREGGNDRGHEDCSRSCHR